MAHGDSIASKGSYRTRKVWSNILPLLLIPIVAACLHISCQKYFVADVAAFDKWSVFWSHQPADIYRLSKLTNYPFVGVVMTGGVLSSIRELFPTWETHQVHSFFREILNVWDVAAAYLVFALLWTLGVSGAAWVALLIYCLPSTWVGGAMWAQIDGITQAFILLSLLGFSISMKVRGNYSILALFLGIVGAVAGMLTKQLIVFSLPGLAMLWFFAIRRLISDQGSKGKIAAIGSVVIALLLLFIPDLFLRVPEGYFSHIAYLLFGGEGRHKDVIEISGFNIWTFLGRVRYSSSNIPYFLNWTPKISGIILYLVFLSIVYGKVLVQLFRGGFRDSNDEIAAVLFALALGNLGFNVLLTGTHERYLYHFYPFLIIALAFYAVRRQLNLWSWLAPVAFSASLYGAFVYSIMDMAMYHQKHLVLGSTSLITLVHLALLAFLTRKWISLAH